MGRDFVSALQPGGFLYYPWRNANVTESANGKEGSESLAIICFKTLDGSHLYGNGSLRQRFSVLQSTPWTNSQTPFQWRLFKSHVTAYYKNKKYSCNDFFHFKQASSITYKMYLTYLLRVHVHLVHNGCSGRFLAMTDSFYHYYNFPVNEDGRTSSSTWNTYLY
jgi:hypothetical protein